MDDVAMGSGPDLLRAAMKVRGVTQTALETLVGASKGLASRWLSGERVPELKFALAIEENFGVPARAWLRSEQAATGTEG